MSAGHSISGHGWRDVDLTSLPACRRLLDIHHCRHVLAPHGCNLFRPPYGAFNGAVRRDLSLMGYRLVLWSASAEDWEPRLAAQMLAKLREGLKPGAIFLLHDHLAGPRLEGAADRSTMLSALAEFLSESSPDFEFVTVPELMVMNQR